MVGLDPTDDGAIEDFQRDHDLQVDGVIGPRTQAVLHSLHQELAVTGREEEADGDHEQAPLELDRELTDLVSTLGEQGPMSRGELRRELNAGLWGPGRLRYVLRTAEEEGQVRRIGRDRYETAGR